MDFLKKNYMKLIISVVMTAGAVLFIILLAKYDAKYHNNFVNQFDPTKSGTDSLNASSVMLSYIAALIFFIGGLVLTVMTMCSKAKAHGKWAILGIGAICTVIMAVSIVNALSSKASAYANEVMAGDYDSKITASVTAAVAYEVNKAVIADPLKASLGLVIAGDEYEAKMHGIVTEWEPYMNASVEGSFAVYKATIENTAANTATDQIKGAKDSASYNYFSGVVARVTYLVIFGLLPLCLGIHKATKKDE